MANLQVAFYLEDCTDLSLGELTVAYAAAMRANKNSGEFWTSIRKLRPAPFTSPLGTCRSTCGRWRNGVWWTS